MVGSGIWPRRTLTLGGMGDVRIGDLTGRMRHSGCGGEPKLVELVIGVVGSDVEPDARDRASFGCRSA